MHGVVNATSSRAVRPGDRGVILLTRMLRRAVRSTTRSRPFATLKKSSGARERGHVDSNTWL